MHSQRPHVDYKYSLHKGPMDVSTRCSVGFKKKKKKRRRCCLVLQTAPSLDKTGRSNISYKRHHSDVTLHSGYELFLSLHRMNVKNTMVEMVLCSCILYVMIRQKKPSEKENIVCVGEVIITVAIIKRKSRQRQHA